MTRDELVNQDPNEADPFAPLPRHTPASSSAEAPYGLSFWNNRGYSNSDMFDANGQPRPGWTRTGSGYMYEPPVANTGGGPTGPTGPNPQAGPDGSTNPNMDPPGFRGGYWMGGQWVQGSPYGGGGDGGTGGAGGPFSPVGGGDLPPPVYRSAGPWNFDPFSPSSWADAENEPGYQESRRQLRRQIEAGAAHRGMVLSGMTIGDLYSNLDALSQQNFRQFDDRRFRNWEGNRDLSMTQHRFQTEDVDRANNFAFNTWDRQFQDRLARWTENVRSLTSLAQPVE